MWSAICVLLICCLAIALLWLDHNERKKNDDKKNS